MASSIANFGVGTNAIKDVTSAASRLSSSSDTACLAR
jgi:hypothetical protein